MPCEQRCRVKARNTTERCGAEPAGAASGRAGGAWMGHQQPSLARGRSALCGGAPYPLRLACACKEQHEPASCKWPMADRQSAAQSRCRCGRGGRSPGADVGNGEPSRGADVAGVSAVPVQMWAGVSAVPAPMWRRRAQSRCTFDTNGCRSVAARLSGCVSANSSQTVPGGQLSTPKASLVPPRPA